MQQRHIIGLVIITITLTMGFFISPPVSQAITKVTPTPVPSDGSQPPATQVDIEALLEEAVSKLDAMDYEGAIADLTRILQADSSLWDAYFFRAFAYTQSEEPELAIADYSRAIDIIPHDWTVLTLRGDLYLTTEDFAKADADYTQAIYRNPRYATAYAGKSLLNVQQNAPTLAEIYRGIYQSLQATTSGNVNDGIDILTDTIDNVTEIPTPPDLGYVYYTRSNAYIGLAQWDQALADMNQAIELQPDMQDYYMARGFIYSQTEKLDLAAPDFFQRMSLLEISSIDNTINIGQSIPIEMNYGVVARLSFSGESGQQVTITARDSASVGVDPLLVLLDTDGNPLVGNDDSGGQLDALINNYELPVIGTYTVMVSHANGGFAGTVNVSLK